MTNLFMKRCHFSLAKIFSDRKNSPMKRFSMMKTLIFILIFTDRLISADKV